ncbi:MAG: hydroxyacid dehydrogenase [Gammaproteobacteria bacterium]|nr:MAG: hydroxyacid dehydrogenase [Gammaproteobacteria bacterium]
MKAVFLDSKTFSSSISFNGIAEQCSEFINYGFTSKEQIIPRCKNAEIIITNKVELTDHIIAQLPKLKLICVAATGTNNVDLNAAQQQNITVKNVSNYAGTTIAQYVFAQLLEYFQHINSHNNDVKQGLWQQNSTTDSSFCYHGNAIEELAGKTLGIIGYGNLGKSVEKVAQALAMNILISEHKGATKIRAGRVSFEALLSNADIISLHCPQNPQTINLIDSSALSLMKSQAILINTARGALIDDLALITALKNQQIAYAIVDVLDQEPPSANHPLLEYQRTAQANNLTITAHIAWASMQSQQRLINILATNIKNFKLAN